MIFKVEKRCFRRNGKLRSTRCYYLRYRLGDMPVDRWKSLGVTDLAVANKKAQEFIQEKEREAAGIIEPKVVRDAAKKSLREHLTDYVADLGARNRAGRGGRGARLVQSRIVRLLDECGWTCAASITPDSFETWRKQCKGGARTRNHYLQGMISFLNWMERVGRIKVNPLKHVSKVDERGQRKRIRRAFTDDELRRLVTGSGPRGVVYLTAARTGLRQEELRQLTWGDVHLDKTPPFIVVRDVTTKNKKSEHVPLIGDVVEALEQHRSSKAIATDLVFPSGIPRASRLRVDAEKNGVQYRDELGRYADFHALRYTWATFLQRHGVPLRFATKLMRHSDVKLTAKVYTDETQLPIYDSIKALPSLWGCTQIRAQISGWEGQNGARAVATGEGSEADKSVCVDAVCPTLTLPVGGSELERAKGFEPSTFTLAR